MHDRFVKLATRLIKKNGRQLSIVSIGLAGTAWDPTPAETITTVIGVQTNFNVADVDGNLVQETDKQYLINSAIMINAEMRIRDNGVDYSIVNINEIMPGETLVMYKVHVQL